MLNVDSLEKGLGIVSSLNSVYDFSRKIFLMLHSINWANFTASLALILKVLDKICIVIVCFRVCDVINLEINLIFLMKRFFYMNEKSKQKLRYLENEKSFPGEIKNISLFLKDFHLPKIVSDLRVGLKF